MIVRIHNTDLAVREWNGERVVTLPDIDRVHERPSGTAGRNFREHRDRLIEGMDYIHISEADEIRRLGFTRPQGGIPAEVLLITESGYLMLVKSLTDDLAWQVQRQLVSSYFRAKPVDNPLEEIIHNPSKVLGLIGAYAEKQLELEATIAEQAPAVEFASRLQAAEGEFTVREAAKLLEVGERWLFEWLGTNGVIYRPTTHGSKGYLASYSAIQTKRLTQRTSEHTGVDDVTHIYHSIRITPKGLAWIGEKLLAEEGVA